MENSIPALSSTIVSEGALPERIDKYLSRQYPTLSRSLLQKLLKDDRIIVNGRRTKLSTKVQAGDSIAFLDDVELLSASKKNTTTTKQYAPNGEEMEGSADIPVLPQFMKGQSLEPENIELDILYDDQNMAVINKPAGLMVHPSPGHLKGTLVNALLHKYGHNSLTTLSGIERPGIVHRLDRDTCGLMMIAKTDEAYLALKSQFTNRTLVKKYAAIVVGKPHDINDNKHSSFEQSEQKTNFINKPIARHPKDINKMVVVNTNSNQISNVVGKEASTEYSVTKTWKLPKKEIFSFVDVQIHTGRTHQIRVHMASIGTPIVGDPIYCKRHTKYGVPFLMLVSRYLQFNHPITQETQTFQLPLPSHMNGFIENYLDKNQKVSAE